jgi:hypothetical protein
MLSPRFAGSKSVDAAALGTPSALGSVIEFSHSAVEAGYEIQPTRSSLDFDSEHLSQLLFSLATQRTSTLISRPDRLREHRAQAALLHLIDRFGRRAAG